MNCSFKVDTIQKRILGLKPISIGPKLYCYCVEFSSPTTVPKDDEEAIREILRVTLRSALLSTDPTASTSVDSILPTFLSSSSTAFSDASSTACSPDDTKSSTASSTASTDLSKRIDRLVNAFFDSDASVTLIIKDQDIDLLETPTSASSRPGSPLLKMAASHTPVSANIHRKLSTSPGSPTTTLNTSKVNGHSNSPQNFNLGIMLSS